MPDSPLDVGSPPIPVLKAERLGYRFADGDWAFREIDFELRSGAISLLAGRNGAGKTLLAKSLAGLIEPSEGRVLAQGEADIRGPRAALVGYVFQDARLQCVGERVWDDLLFGPMNLRIPEAAARERAETALRACGLAELRDSFVHSLSGGEQRRLAIAGVMALNPRALILDEPFANLDLEGVRAVLKIARDAARGGTAVLVVTHELEKVLGLASFFTIMEGGRIVQAGAPGEVLSAGIERFGLRDPLRSASRVEELQWLE
jgi:biotin transport system ATP-binding protein